MTIAAAARAESPAPPLPQAHSHNDYEHERPLFDALDRGFCNIEADVHLVDGKLLVGHDPEDVAPQRTLQALYLDPLQKLIAERDGKIFPDGQRLTLLVDFKTDGPAIYQALAKALKPYEAILSGLHDGQWQPRQVDVVISGNRPIDVVEKDKKRLASIDGRVDDLENGPPADLMPLISDNWTNHFTWQGKGPIPAAERAKLHALAKTAHDQNRRLRFWATPDAPAFWQELQAANVDVIGADDHPLLQSHLSSPK
ncbi:MAG: hypothetical protein C0485_04175 [Pirellula sp.]|nr:hypothetical protein [Pirellula sp.]